MPPKRSSFKRTGRTGRNGSQDMGGMDPEFLKLILRNIPPNRQTGRVELADIMSYMGQNPDQMSRLMSQMDNLEMADRNVDLSSYDYAPLATSIKPESFWAIQLETMGIVDASGIPVDLDSLPPEGAKPSLMIYCYDNEGMHRVMYDCVGLPDSKAVVQAIRLAIVKPIAPLKPALPSLLIVSSKLQQHKPVVKPFLDSLPAPFTWRFETREEAEELMEGIHQKNQQGVRDGLQSAEELKRVGNTAFSSKNRNKAVKAYTDASKHLLDVLSQKPDIDDERKAKKQLAICYANRAAAHLFPGEGMDAKAALRDGEAAEKFDSNYLKAYIRQASANQALNQIEQAMDVLAKGLRRSELENEVGLVDRLIELQTDGKGLSNDRDIFMAWILEVTVNDQKSATRMKGIEGEWRRRVDNQSAVTSGKDKLKGMNPLAQLIMH